MPQTLKSPLKIAKSSQPFKTPLLLLVSVGFCAGLFLMASVWLFSVDLGLASGLLTLVMLLISMVFLLIALRIYAHISLILAQSDQKHLQNALIQAKDMLDTSKQLREDHIVLQSLVQNLPFPVWLKDRLGRYLVANHAFVQQWANGIEPKGLTDADLLNAKLVKSFMAADQAALSTGTAQKLDLRLDFSGQTAKWVRIERYPLQGEAQQAVGVLGFAIDISPFKTEANDQSEAYRDPLTDLANNNGLNRHLDRVQLSDAESVWCVTIDIDHFKVMNDSLGPDSGDQLLIQVAERIERASQSGDFMARPSADEYVLFWLDSEHADLERRLQDLHSLLNQPLTIDRSQYSFTTSIGVAKSPEQGDTLRALKQHASVALFNAKKLGRNQIHWYQDQYHDQALRRLNKAQALHQAIIDHDFSIQVQPRVDCRTGTIEALECLVRIRLADGGLLYPDHFIELAEQNGLVREIDIYMLDQALTTIDSWLEQAIEPLSLAVNLSIQSINKNLISQLQGWQQRNPAVFQYLELELTEHRIPENNTEFLAHLGTVRDMGIHLALDDFGTGYANLSRLPEWPFQILKLDRSFIVDLPNSPKQQAVVKSVIDLCQALEIQVVAEGVETEAELTLIDQLGCHSIQGFVYARPKPLADAGAWLVQRKIGVQ